MSVVAVEQLLQYWTDYTNSDQKDAAVQLLRRNAYQWSAEHCTFRASGADELAALNDPKRLPPLFTYADAVQNVSFVVLAKHAYVTGAPDSATLRVVVVPVFDDSANPITLLTYIDHDEDEEEDLDLAIADKRLRPLPRKRFDDEAPLRDLRKLTAKDYGLKIPRGTAVYVTYWNGAVGPTEPDVAGDVVPNYDILGEVKEEVGEGSQFIEIDTFMRGGLPQPRPTTDLVPLWAHDAVYRLRLKPDVNAFKENKPAWARFERSVRRLVGFTVTPAYADVSKAEGPDLATMPPALKITRSRQGREITEIGEIVPDVTQGGDRRAYLQLVPAKGKPPRGWWIRSRPTALTATAVPPKTYATYSTERVLYGYVKSVAVAAREIKIVRGDLEAAAAKTGTVARSDVVQHLRDRANYVLHMTAEVKAEPEKSPPPSPPPPPLEPSPEPLPTPEEEAPAQLLERIRRLEAELRRERGLRLAAEEENSRLSSNLDRARRSSADLERRLNECTAELDSATVIIRRLNARIEQLEEALRQAGRPPAPAPAPVPAPPPRRPPERPRDPFAFERALANDASLVAEPWDQPPPPPQLAAPPELAPDLQVPMSAAFFRHREDTAVAIVDTRRAVPMVGITAGAQAVHSDYALMIDAVAAQASTYGGAHVRGERLRYLHQLPARGSVRVLWLQRSTSATYDLTAVARPGERTVVLSVPLFNDPVARSVRRYPPVSVQLGFPLRDAKLHVVLRAADASPPTYDVIAVHATFTWAAAAAVP